MMEEWRRKDIAWNIVYTDPEAIHVLQHDLQEDPEIFQQAIIRGLKIIPSNLANHRYFMLNFCTQIPDRIKQASDQLQQDRAFILEVVKIKPRILEFLDPRFQDDEEVVMTAITTKGSTLCYASARLQESRDMVIQAIKSLGKDASIRIPESITMDRELIELLALHSGNNSQQYRDAKVEIMTIDPRS